MGCWRTPVSGGAAAPGGGPIVKRPWALIGAEMAPIFANAVRLAGENPGLKTYYEKQMTKLMGKLDASKGIPKILDAEEQGMFILGYYQQTQARYEKKED